MYQFSPLDLSSWFSYKEHSGSKSVSLHDLVSLCLNCKSTVLKAHIPFFPILNTCQRIVTNFLPEPTNISAELDKRANWDAQSNGCTPSIPHTQTQEHAWPRKCSALWLWRSFTAPAQSPHHRQQRPMLYLSLLSSAKKVWQVNNRENTWIIYILANHGAQRCVPPCAGSFGDYCWAQCHSP